MSEGLRFLHASDFRLDQPLEAGLDVPPELRDLLIDAPYLAATRVFDAAVNEDVAFLALSGNLLKLDRAGPRGPVFLVEQFERLAASGIGVYWCGGPTDPPDQWPSVLRLPENVHVFPAGRISERVHERGGLPLARLIGISLVSARQLRPNDFEPDAGGLPTVAVACGSAEPAALAARGLHYWALGGLPARTTLQTDPCVAHFPGSPQGRRAEEKGVSGCTLVEWEAGRPRTSLVPCDVARWADQRLVIDGKVSRGELEQRLRSAAQELRAAAPIAQWMVRWSIGGSGPLWNELRRGALAEELLEWLRAEFGSQRPGLWSLGVEGDATAAPPHGLLEEESILGDYLREIRSAQLNPQLPLELDVYLNDSQLAGELAMVAQLPAGDQRERALAEAAWLGVDLLAPQAQ
ncbi:MAG: metallophosphoesterase family protein [Planctomycetota bacterium]